MLIAGVTDGNCGAPSGRLPLLVPYGKRWMFWYYHIRHYIYTTLDTRPEDVYQTRMIILHTASSRAGTIMLTLYTPTYRTCNVIYYYSAMFQKIVQPLHCWRLVYLEFDTVSSTRLRNHKFICLDHGNWAQIKNKWNYIKLLNTKWWVDILVMC